MEDSPAKTIAFLRARLHAERSVSRTARQRAYELAKRVTELEKQLKFVSLQRKKAEKATVDVLAILENHGRNDLSEPFDSSSDQEEMSSDFKDDQHVKTSDHVKVQESDTDGFSGSEVESSSVNGRSLSWKSSKNSSSRFLEKKYMDASRRRRNSFTSTGSSPRCVGKSCRQIRHREHRSVADGLQNDATNAHHEDEGQTNSEGVQNSADVATQTSIEHKIHEEKDPPKIPSSSCNGHISQNHGTERDMERALEHQAQFIAQYEAEEKAQREWEDKFRENNGSTPTPDSCDPGTHSDVTEERDEIKAPAPTPGPAPAPTPPCSTDKLASGGQETEADAVDANFSEEPKINTEPLLDQKNSDMKTEKSDNQNYPPDLQGTPRNFIPARASSSQDSSLYRGEQSSGKSYEPALETQETPNKLESVLEALQQAKFSLKQNLDKFPLLESTPPIPTYRSGDKFPVPFTPAGLFRLPTDYEYEGSTPRANSLTYDSRLSLTNYPTEPSRGPFISSPYREPLSRSAASSLDDRFRMVPTFPYQETRLELPTQPPPAFSPRLDMLRSPLDPRLDLGVRTDPRLGMGASAYDPRLDVGVGTDPRLGMGASAYDPRLDVGVGTDPRLSPRLGTGVSAYEPRLEIGSPFTGDRYTRRGDHPHSSAGMPSSSSYGRTPPGAGGGGGGGADRTRSSAYGDYTRPNRYE